MALGVDVDGCQHRLGNPSGKLNLLFHGGVLVRGRPNARWVNEALVWWVWGGGVVCR